MQAWMAFLHSQAGGQGSGMITACCQHSMRQALCLHCIDNHWLPCMARQHMRIG
jgi:hypothetical protein